MKNAANRIFYRIFQFSAFSITESKEKNKAEFYGKENSQIGQAIGFLFFARIRHKNFVKIWGRE